MGHGAGLANSIDQEETVFAGSTIRVRGTITGQARVVTDRAILDGVDIGVGVGQILARQAVSSGRASSSAITVTIISASTSTQDVAGLIVRESPFHAGLNGLATAIEGQLVTLWATGTVLISGAGASQTGFVTNWRRRNALSSTCGCLENIWSETAGTVIVSQTVACCARLVTDLTLAVDQDVACSTGSTFTGAGAVAGGAAGVAWRTFGRWV